MPINVFIILGNRNTRKSSTVRALTGLGRRGICQIELTTSLDGILIDLYTRISALQESKDTPGDFVNEVNAKDNENILVPLWIDQMNDLPNGQTYIETFVAAGWNIKQIEVLGTNTLPYTIEIPKTMIHFHPNSSERPNNRNIIEIKSRWGWL
jgi:hypothetical protein